MIIKQQLKINYEKNMQYIIFMKNEYKKIMR